MSHLGRACLALTATGALLAVGAPVSATPVTPQEVTTKGSVTTAAATKPVSFRGVTVRVPADWPVIDLDRSPRTCVRLDRHAVYVGTPGADQDCPARAIGRAETIHLSPTTAEDRRRASTLRPAVAGERMTLASTRGVTVRTTWADTEPTQPTIETSDAGTTAADAATVTAETTPALATAAAASTSAATAVAATGTALTGMAFDTCAAPSASTMAAWRASPYAAVGIYIGGSQRACGDGNLSASWVSTVTAQGWGLIPIYVGLQAPCVAQDITGVMSTNPTTAASQARAAAADAVAQAKRFGLAAGSVVHYDIENYSMGNTVCTTAVLAFVTAWTDEVRRLGYAAGVYGNTGSLMADMSRRVAAGDATFHAPDQVWFARWDGVQTTSAAAATPEFKDSYWSNHQRLKQYRGDFAETWGGVRIAIDGNWVDTTLPGNATQTDYGTNVVGPGSKNFVFTGSTTRWTPRPGEGLRGRAYSTLTTGSTTEGEGATWSPTLAPGLYAVSANVPSGGSTGDAQYTVTDARGTSRTVLDQATAKGYRSLGSYLAQSGKPIIVHLGDNDPTSTSAAVAADAMRFVQVAGLPGAPTGVSAAASDGRAQVSWAAAPDGGSPVTAYKVTASPGGASVSVGGTARSAAVTGLTNGTSYTFTVSATNLVGSGPSSAASAAVVPTAAGGFAPVTPVRLVDSRVGTVANPGLRTALAPGATVRIAVAGVSGSPVPASASSAMLNLTVTGGTRAGHVDVAGATNSLLNFTAGQVVANVAAVRLGTDGTVRLTNASSGTVHLIADVQGYVAPQVSGRWTTTAATRLLDTRVGTSTNARRTAIGPGESVAVSVAGITGSPVLGGAAAAGLRVTATNATRSGHLSLSDGSGGPSSVVNFTTAGSIGNFALAKLSSTGTVILRNGGTGTVHVLLDAMGQVSGTGSRWTPVAPVRLVDTRTGTAANARRTALAAGETITVRVAGGVGTPIPAGAAAVGVNVTVTGSTRPGWVAAAPTGTPALPVVNFTAGQTIAGMSVSAVAADGTLRIRNGSTGTVQVVIDVQGYAAP